MPGLSHRAVEALPLPVDAGQLLAAFDQQRPEAADHVALDPPLEGAVNTGIVAEFLGQLVPLHTAAHAVDHAVQGLALVDAVWAENRPRVVLRQHLLCLRPQHVVHSPNRRPRRRHLFPTRHPWLLSLSPVTIRSKT